MEEQTGVVDSPQQTEFNLADVSTDDLREALSTNEPVQVEAPAESQPEEQSQEAQPEATSTEEEVSLETAEPQGEVESEEERLAKRRIRPKSELDQQVIDLYRSEGFGGTFADAAKVIYGQETQNQPQPQPVQPQEAQQPTDPFAQEAGTLNAQIQELEGKVKEAAEDLDTLQALNFQREIMKKELQLQNIQDRKDRADERQREVQYNTHRDKAVESRDRAYESYPDLSNKETLYRKEFDHFIEQAQSSPDYSVVFQSPKWPEIMAHDFAAQKGQAPSVQQPQQQVEQRQVRPAMGNQAKVLTTGQTTQPVQQTLTPESIVNNMGSMSNDQLYDLLGQPDGRSFLR
jgi:hypothetical protein